MTGTEIRKRVKNHRKESAPELQPHARSKTQFVPRESLLTQLLTTSAHIRAIYHIFLVILAMLFFDTVLYDFFQHGKIDAGVGTVLAGFGDVRRAARLWLYELMVALTFLPGFHLYGAVYRMLRQYTAIRRIWTALGIVGLICIQALLLGVPLWSLSKERLALASAATVTCEMFRFAMKIHAVAAECAGRCAAGERAQPLPTFSQYIYFLFAPTLIYRDQYPRTKSTRWRLVVYYFAEVAGIVFYNSFLWERFIIPRWHEYGEQEQVEIGVMLRDMFACVLPSVLAFLCGFYCLLHAWFNAFAEMLTFADRLFYEDWWTQSQFSHFYRSWNLVVHTWLREYIYRPLSLHIGRMFATLTVFLVSAVAHEVVLAASFGFFYPVMFLEFGVIGLLVVPLTAVGGRRYPDFYNFLLWLSFFIGNGLMWSLYPMEHFARLNCPPAENDSFFVPKSWSCPRVVIKSNWSFHNPFSLAD